ncbi:methylglyoxal synthase [Tuanshanicoccus lijuaniae]|uniref:methylglyoxal synthase n=1 Tax=Aerococcaceae bacterium zg-1292 TaxID=2774330 RepID=UPI0019355E30|nr:methylglyoxal synthase [Aerococcaceae bacterium zg-1292]MBF6626078.1 methylglyoxal synthase [Aerococcaceae bacterium zg-BR9]MBF6978834.1 methylglyoxal synthase [Aerococcaceae bacterium zg-BR22]MBS4455268.1 methylglyoxal synthase [Aerococcaceae bacterium zg-A91]MBS4457922.1 methylglyoxal synthase [Aerococcaceae bacterium zg-BR33]
MRIALIAHDQKKMSIIELAKKYEFKLAQHDLYATGTTGKVIMEHSQLTINRLNSGPLGGDQQIGGMISEQKLDLVIFLRDPLAAQPHEPDVNALIRLCDVYNIPLATNLGTAEVLLSSLELVAQVDAIY